VFSRKSPLNDKKQQLHNNSTTGTNFLRSKPQNESLLSGSEVESMGSQIMHKISLI
jgi:hypothetical protein